MKRNATTVTVAAALCAAALLLQAEDKPAEQSSPRKSNESDAAFPKPYRVMAVPKTPDDTVEVLGEEKAQKWFQDALNQAHADGYRFAGMNNQWVVLERPPVAETRRRVVFPTSGDQPTVKPVPAPQAAEAAPKAKNPQ